ncbi:MAG: hypothetical protein FD123_3632 [Bacteroidetes bacterium]|nr:MAG: hypothetical protein FD123_3632 [Bacteroidota bacterium]
MQNVKGAAVVNPFAFCICHFTFGIFFLKQYNDSVSAQCDVLLFFAFLPFAFALW